MSDRAGSVLRLSVGAKNSRHNITRHCVTGGKPRLFPLRTQRDVMLSSSVGASSALCAYASPGRGRRQTGVPLRGHPRP